ncbi:hypothetical protein EUAN_23860 [Andreesenia angusta]|uniref:Uncharacterized protein n=2 Tax=Andreesenia angusta TaxID=39480 RepID=A0A1S1V3S7_9FIRM|nr:hypothetical protein EUAN_23860 [Andreesenia angusta]
MAGYIFTLDSLDSLKSCIKKGCYSTNLSAPKNGLWMIHHEGTFADYCGMKPGDSVYFFIDRMIYGRGEMVDIEGDCKYMNYPRALWPSFPEFKNIKDEMLLDDESNLCNRCVCFFKPSPGFFENGIDMDDMLASNPQKIRMLRTLWKLSFIKVDEEEDQALRDAILKRNEASIGSSVDCFNHDSAFHESLSSKVSSRHSLSVKDVLFSCKDGSKLRHEMAIEVAVMDMLSRCKESIFGRWDYVSHQVAASPFKPIDYMDKMDVFGYRKIEGFGTISKYLTIEIKKDAAKKDVINQTMKYVDWINQEYAYGDYSMIEAFILASDFPEHVVKYRDEVCARNYMKGRRPAISETWTNLKLIKYKYNELTGMLDFEQL